VIRPFEVDPEVIARIRPMRHDDLEHVARLHHAAMGRSLWARLGRRFLVRIYEALLDHPTFLGAVYLEDGRIRGFIAGSEDTGAMLRDSLRGHGPRLALSAARGLVGDPRALRPLLETFAYGARSGDDVKAESLFCSFEPELRGKRVSGHINKVLFDELRARGHSRVKVTTEVDNEGARRQLESWGFVDEGRFRFYGKDMIRYVLDLANSPRVQATRRWGAA
jgi:ribosomal protein S18 acetylase RimI-like enzyme